MRTVVSMKALALRNLKFICNSRGPLHQCAQVAQKIIKLLGDTDENIDSVSAIDSRYIGRE